VKLAGHSQSQAPTKGQGDTDNFRISDTEMSAPPNPFCDPPSLMQKIDSRRWVSMGIFIRGLSFTLTRYSVCDSRF